MEDLEELTLKLTGVDARASFVIRVAEKEKGFRLKHDSRWYQESLYKSAIRASEILELDGLKQYFSTELMKHYVLEKDFRLAALLAKQLGLEKEAMEYSEKEGNYKIAADIAKNAGLVKKARKLYQLYVQQRVRMKEFEEAIEITKKENLGGLKQVYTQAIEHYIQEHGWFNDAIETAKEAGWNGKVLEIQERAIAHYIDRDNSESAISYAKETEKPDIVLSTYRKTISKEEHYGRFQKALTFSRDAVDFCIQKGLAAAEFEERAKTYSAVVNRLS